MNKGTEAADAEGGGSAGGSRSKQAVRVFFDPRIQQAGGTSFSRKSHVEERFHDDDGFCALWDWRKEATLKAGARFIYCHTVAAIGNAFFFAKYWKKDFASFH